MASEMSENKKVALVSGAASGIGRATAVALAAAGYDIVINYSRSADAAGHTAGLAQAEGANTLLIQCDVSDDSCVRAMLATVEEKFGRLDALVNNAGTTTNVKPKDFDGLTAEEWDRVFAVNVRGPLSSYQGCSAAVESRPRKHCEHRQRCRS